MGCANAMISQAACGSWVWGPAYIPVGNRGAVNAPLKHKAQVFTSSTVPAGPHGSWARRASSCNSVHGSQGGFLSHRWMWPHCLSSTAAEKRERFLSSSFVPGGLGDGLRTQNSTHLVRKVLISHELPENCLCNGGPANVTYKGDTEHVRPREDKFCSTPWTHSRLPSGPRDRTGEGQLKSNPSLRLLLNTSELCYNRFVLTTGNHHSSFQIYHTQ